MTLEETIELAIWRLLPLREVDPIVVNRAAKVITSLAFEKLRDGNRHD